MKKNISQDVFGSKVAKIHTGRQQVEGIQTRKVKALRSRKQSSTNDGDEGED
jgi:ribosome production factor 2